MSPDAGPAAEPGPGGAALVASGDDLALIAARFGADCAAPGSRPTPAAASASPGP